jgi:hypothetical protein
VPAALAARLLHTLPAGDRDESRFAQASRQMVETGDYVRIRLGEVERNKKPAGIHWAQAAAVHGVEALRVGTRADIWAYRLPSLFGAMLAVLATAYFGRALVGRRAAFLGAAHARGCFVLAVETHIAKTDAALLGSIVVAMGLMGRAYVAPGRLRRAACGGVLAGARRLRAAEGPDRAAGAAAGRRHPGRRGPGHPWGRPWLRLLRPAWGVPLMCWPPPPGSSPSPSRPRGRFIAEALGGDMLGKVGGADENHWGPPGYYLASFGIAAFPAAVLVLARAPGAWADRLRPATRFLLAWAVPIWLMFEAGRRSCRTTPCPLPRLMLWPPPGRWTRCAGAAALAGGAFQLRCHRHASLAIACAVLPVRRTGRCPCWRCSASPPPSCSPGACWREVRRRAPSCSRSCCGAVAGGGAGRRAAAADGALAVPAHRGGGAAGGPGLPPRASASSATTSRRCCSALGGDIACWPMAPRRPASWPPSPAGWWRLRTGRRCLPRRGRRARRPGAGARLVSGFNYSRRRQVAIMLYGVGE